MYLASNLEFQLALVMYSIYDIYGFTENDGQQTNIEAENFQNITDDDGDTKVKNLFRVFPSKIKGRALNFDIRRKR